MPMQSLFQEKGFARTKCFSTSCILSPNLLTVAVTLSVPSLISGIGNMRCRGGVLRNVVAREIGSIGQEKRQLRTHPVYCKEEG